VGVQKKTKTPVGKSRYFLDIIMNSFHTLSKGLVYF